MSPESWQGFEGLRAGFGDRNLQPPPHPLIRIRQVHGAEVVCGDALTPGMHAEIEGDALTITRTGRLAAVATADCVPILLLDPELHWAAAVHAGWRGTHAGVTHAAVRAALARGSRADSLRAALGPSIGPCCYEVGADVAESFLRAGLPVAAVDARGRARLDLRGCNRAILIALGVQPDRIETVGPCTRCQDDRYHSYRRDGRAAGRQLSWIGWEGRSR